jgi:hypothetical protein
MDHLNVNKAGTAKNTGSLLTQGFIDFNETIPSGN